MRHFLSDYGGPGRGFAVLALLFTLLFSALAAAENHALLIGINEYQKVRALKGAVNDIQRIERMVREDLKFPGKNVQVLLNEQATKANILAALESLEQRTRAGDTVLWYYSGHGWVQQDTDGDEKEGDPDDRMDEVLVPYDAVPFPRDRALEANPTMVLDDEIGMRLSRLAGRKLLVIFDSCHSGTATRNLPGEAETRALYENYALPATPKTRSLKRNAERLDTGGSVIFIAAASPVQAASDLGEFDGRRHGAFTASLLRAIQQAGPDWPRSMALEGLFQKARQDMVEQGFGTQTPSLTAVRGMGTMPIEQLLDPPAAAEIALMGAGGSFQVRLAANRHRFENGDLLELDVESDSDGYLYLFDVNAEQAVTQLFPNRFATDNRVKAGVVRSVPAKDEPYQFRAGKPFGRSTVVAIVSAQRWSTVRDLKLPTDFQPADDRQKEALRDGVRELLEATRASRTAAGQPFEWASQRLVVEITAKAATEPALPPPALAAAPSPSVASESQGPVAGLPPPAAVPETVTAPAAEPLAAGGSAAASIRTTIDDADLPREVQADLPRARPELFARLERLAERFAPIFWQDVSGDFDRQFKPWRDFFVRFDFDTTEQGPNWPPPPNFQDENKRLRSGLLNALLTPDPSREITPLRESPGIYRVVDKETGHTHQLDLRPHVYWAVLTTPTHYFFHYVVFHAEDWKGMFGHTADLEGTTIVVERATEKMVAAFTLAHDDVGVVRSLDDEPEGNIGVLVNPAAEARGLFDGEDDRPVDGSLAMETGRDGEPAPREHQDIYVETKGHGQYGPHKIKPSRYIVYANFLDDKTFRAPSFDRSDYPVSNRFAEIKAKHKYRLLYIGAGTAGSRAADEKSLWGEYKELSRFGGGANPPWEWRDNLFFKTGWWRDPRKIKKIGAAEYRLNPYQPPGRQGH